MSTNDDKINETDQPQVTPSPSVSYISEEEIQFCNSCVIPEDENYIRVEGVEHINDIVNRDFAEELRKSYNPENETGDEVGRLIKMKRLTQTYVTLFNKNVELTPPALIIIGQCEQFISRIKNRIRELCSHTITEDDIEVGENIVHIIYCNRCETMF